MAEPRVRARPRFCPRCGAHASVASNPYFGVGLAVHSHLWTCTRCEFVGLLNIREPAPDRRAEPAVVSQAAPRRWGGARLLGLIRMGFGRR